MFDSLRFYFYDKMLSHFYTFNIRKRTYNFLSNILRSYIYSYVQRHSDREREREKKQFFFVLKQENTFIITSKKYY